jgi:ribonuclease R
MSTNSLSSSLKQQVIDLLEKSDASLTKNQIAKALAIRGDQRVVLKEVLRELEHDGVLYRGKRRRLEKSQKPAALKLSDLIVAEIVDVDEDGVLIAQSIQDESAPSIQVVDNKSRSRSPLGLGARILLQIVEVSEGNYEGTVIRRLEREKRQHVGIFTPHRSGGHLGSCHRKDTFPGARLNPLEAEGLEEGDVVCYSVASQGVKIQKVLGKMTDSKIFSLLAIYGNHLPFEFSRGAIEEAEAGKIPPLERRVDLRHLDLVTIDGEDARDFDDAVWAEADSDSRNPGGWRIVVAIADVAYYVRLNSDLDKEARLRGNSVYFPDRVVPMLPEALSNELCSLKPGVDRACMAIEMIISSHGKIKSHKVKRGLMRSRARLTYNQVQQTLEGKEDSITGPIKETVILPLYGAYQSLLKARKQRGTLELDIPERQIIFDGHGMIKDIKVRERFDSHKLIEEFMIAANVAAAKTLVGKNWPCMFRVHESPDSLKIASLRQLLKQMKISMAKTVQPTPHQFNELLTAVANKPYHRLVSDLILRSQAQARYSPINVGHFGLSLSHYAHFTSPIRRYADLTVHRSLISALGLGDDGYLDKPTNFDRIGDHISSTERQAALAEREVIDRYAIAFIAHRVGEVFKTTIVGVNRFGLFIEVNDIGAQGFLPKGNLGADTFYFDSDHHRLVGRRSRKIYQLGDQVLAQLTEADILSSSLIFTIQQKLTSAETTFVNQKKKLSPKRRKR